MFYRDADVKEESFLEYINQLVMTGEVAGLFPKEEMDALLNDVRGVFKKENPGGYCSPCAKLTARYSETSRH